MYNFHDKIDFLGEEGIIVIGFVSILEFICWDSSHFIGVNLN